MKALLATFLFLFAMAAPAAPIAIVNDGTDSITLFDEPCRLKAPNNFKNRAVWAEAGKSRKEACYSVNGYGIVMLYLETGDAAALPASMFNPVKNIDFRL